MGANLERHLLLLFEFLATDNVPHDAYIMRCAREKVKSWPMCVVLVDVRDGIMV